MSQIDTGIRQVLAKPGVYDFFQDLVGAGRLRIRWIQEVLRPFSGARILDIGCGTAELLQYLPMDIEYTGFDMSPAYIDAAQKRYGNRGTFTCEKVNLFEPEDIQTKTPGKGGFDIVLAFGVLHHLNNEEGRQLFSSAREALKPGGRLVTIDPTFVKHQSVLAHFMVSRDRGRNVRFPEGYASLGENIFANISVSIWHNALRMPYDHAVLECLL
jgi:2-polyprenyl-3-methyl-5-hydroxy-6-metoxy-1,4-benzoquinol methylase